MIRSTKSFPNKERKEIIKFAEKEGKSGSFIEEDKEEILGNFDFELPELDFGFERLIL